MIKLEAEFVRYRGDIASFRSPIEVLRSSERYYLRAQCVRLVMLWLCRPIEGRFHTMAEWNEAMTHCRKSYDQVPNMNRYWLYCVVLTSIDPRCLRLLLVPGTD